MGIIRGFSDKLVFPAVDAVCLYRISEQDKDHKRLDAFASYSVDEAGEKSYIVGVAVEALERGEEYTAAVLAHELAHIEVDRAGGDITSHGPEFVDAVKRLADRYEERTGKHLPDDATGVKAT